MENLNPKREVKPRGLQYFPEDIVHEILLRLPAKSVARFRCVSKTWLSIGTDCSFLHAHSHRAPKSLLRLPAFKSPKFRRVHFVAPELFTAADGFSSGRIAATRSTLYLPEVFHSTFAEPLACCDGLVFLHTGGDEGYYVLNPLTGQCTTLPRPHYHLDIYRKSFGFYFHRWTSEYRLVSIDIYPVTNPLKSEVLTLGSNSWRKINAFPTVNCTNPHHSPVSLDDFLYWISYEVSYNGPPVILVFDIRAELFTIMKPPPYREEWKVMLHERSWSVEVGLVDINAKLGFYIFGRDERGVRIDVWLMEDYQIKQWTKFYSASFSIEFCLRDGISYFNLYAKDGELLLVYDIDYRRFIVRCDMNSGKYCADEVSTDALFILTPTIIYKETLISYDSFCNR